MGASLGPMIQYATSGDVNVAYLAIGEGPLDVVIVPGYVSHLEIGFENPAIRKMTERLVKFARLIVFDKRGTGMSDPVDSAPTLEQRMDDVRAVMDAAGSERAALIGVSEGGPMAILFAATYPQRTQALVLYGAMARSTWAPDYPWATPKEALIEAAQELMAPDFGSGNSVEVFAPSQADNPKAREWMARMERFAATPAMRAQLLKMSIDIDVRPALSLISAPTLVLHRKGDRVVNINSGRYLAEHIDGAKLVELEGRDHLIWYGGTDEVIGEIEQFLTGSRSGPVQDADRMLATVMFVDVVGSTQRAAEMGDRPWAQLLESFYAVVRRQLNESRGREVKTMGDGFLATFDGPARAVQAGQAVVEGVRRLGLEVRVGLHAGEVQLMDDDIGGLAVHIGARIGSSASAGEVLVSSSVVDLVAGSGITFTDRGEHTLKGVPGEWHLFAVAG
jgi:class 3 adenylate cyclase/dienelactone hydrolase